jgi:LmbE family N-acetylglucosaminyl deacetylase
MAAGVVALVAHPDDESLIAGGTLIRAADAGFETGVVALTRGELGVMNTTAPSSEPLGAVREREFRAAAETLGADWAACLRHPDGELEWGDHRAIAGEVAELLAERRPSAILTFGPEGLYWHPDHIATRVIAGLLAEVLQEEGGEEVWIYEAIWADGMVAEMVAAAAKRGLPTGTWGIDPDAFGSSAHDATLSIDVRPAVNRKLAALRAHRTQLGSEHLLAALPEDLALRYLGTELWRAVPTEGTGEGPLGRLR